MVTRHCTEFTPHESYIAFSPLLEGQLLSLLPDHTPELLTSFPGSLFIFPLSFFQNKLFSLLSSNLKHQLSHASAKAPDLEPLTLSGNSSLIRVKFPLTCICWIWSVLFQNTVQEKQLIPSGELPQFH